MCPNSNLSNIMGHSTTTWTEFCHFLPHPPCVDSFYTLSVDENRHFLTPSPPHLAHVVIEWPLWTIFGISLSSGVHRPLATCQGCQSVIEKPRLALVLPSSHSYNVVKLFLKGYTNCCASAISFCDFMRLLFNLT